MDANQKHDKTQKHSHIASSHTGNVDPFHDGSKLWSINSQELLSHVKIYGTEIVRAIKSVLLATQLVYLTSRTECLNNPL